MKPLRSSLVTKNLLNLLVEKSPNTSTLINNSGKSFWARSRTPNSLLSMTLRTRFRVTLDYTSCLIDLLMILLRRRLRRRR